MATLDTTAAAAILKEYYTDQRVKQLTYKDAPLYALIAKKTFDGDTYPLPMRVTNPQGASQVFANAQAQKVASNYKKFSLTRVNTYTLASISTEAMLASQSNAGAFLSLATAEIDGAFETGKRRLGWQVYGLGDGMLGYVSGSGSISSANPAVITLANVEDICKFEVGQLIQARNTGTARVFATSVTTATVVGIDRDLGTITTDADNSANTDTFTTNTSLNVVGDYNACYSGLSAWIPAAAPAATAFFGVDRTSDVTRLGGIRNTGTGKPIDEALIDAARRVGREGIGNPNYVFSGFSRYASLEKMLGSRVRYNDVEVAGVGFRGIELSGPQGKMTVLADRDCPEATMWMLDLSSWGIYAVSGKPLMFLDQDGNKMLREGAADSLEVRIGGYAQMGTNSPGSNCRITF